MSRNNRNELKFKADNYVAAYVAASEGATDDTIARSLGVNVSTLRKWVARKPAFRRAIEKGREQLDKGKLASLIDQVKSSKARRFLVAYSECGVISQAARTAGVYGNNHFQTWLNDETYQQAFQEADRIANDYLLQEARRRAVRGVSRMKFHMGVPIMIPCKGDDPDAIETTDSEGHPHFVKPYVEHAYSDKLLEMLIKWKFPDARDKPIEVNNQTNVGLQVNMPELLEQIENGRTVDEDFIEQAATQFLTTVELPDQVESNGHKRNGRNGKHD